MLVKRGKEMKIFNIIITTKKKQELRDKKCFAEGWDRGKFFINQNTWSAINPVIYDLERLRANTWDQDKITYIQKWLKDNFEVK